MLIDGLKQNIQVYICYYGPLHSGKTTSIEALFKQLGKKARIFSTIDSWRRYVVFNYEPIKIEYQQWDLKIHIFSSLEKDFSMIIDGSMKLDGIIFVASSQQEVYSRNLNSWNELCNSCGDDIIDLPKVLAFNKQDLPDKFSIEEFLEDINYSEFNNIDFKETIAISGEGILDCLRRVLSLSLNWVFEGEDISLNWD